MVRVYYFEKLNGVEILRIAPGLDLHPPEVGTFQMTYGKWAFIVEYLKLKTEEEDQWPNVWYCDGGGETSALCHTFKNCNTCPVYKKTGRYACFGTPHEDYRYKTTLRNARRMRNYLYDLMVETGVIG